MRSVVPVAGLALCGFVILIMTGTASAQAPDVQSIFSDGSFPIVRGPDVATIYVHPDDYAGVARAAGDPKADIARVTNRTATLSRDERALGKNVIIIGTVGRSPIINQLARDSKLDLSSIQGRWESFFLQVIPQPLPGVAGALVICGSDKRGTIYGIYELSEQMGVSPWYWWADVPIRHRDELFVKAGRYEQGEPSVRYRGIFLNDEAPDLTNWVAEKYGTVTPSANPPIPPNVANYNSRFYARIFELILRLKGNYLWPAMWNNVFNEDDPENARLADEYGIAMGTSHQEPMLRAQKEWDRRYRRTWNYHTDGGTLRNFWREGIRRNRNFESIITIGLRGANDDP